MAWCASESPRTIPRSRRSCGCSSAWRSTRGCASWATSSWAGTSRSAISRRITTPAPSPSAVRATAGSGFRGRISRGAIPRRRWSPGTALTRISSTCRSTFRARSRRSSAPATSPSTWRGSWGGIRRTWRRRTSPTMRSPACGRAVSATSTSSCAAARCRRSGRRRSSRSSPISRASISSWIRASSSSIRAASRSCGTIPRRRRTWRSCARSPRAKGQARRAGFICVSGSRRWRSKAPAAGSRECVSSATGSWGPPATCAPRGPAKSSPCRRAWSCARWGTGRCHSPACPSTSGRRSSPINAAG